MKATEKLFNWGEWGEGHLPNLEPHSEAKLKVLRDYVVDYIMILCSQSFGQDHFSITLVDGFSGGGKYDGDKLGSPLVLIKAVEEAEAKLNLDGRSKPIRIDCEYHFIDEDKHAIDCLRYQLETSGYKDQLGKSIFIGQGSFEQRHHEIVDRLQKRHPRGGARVIFFLDQCGYSQVDPETLRSISAKLDNKAEFIINFAIEWLMDFFEDTAKFRKRLSTMKLEKELSAEELLKIKETGGVHWKYIAEAKIGPAFKKISGSPFFSPFYIEPVDGHRGYWLLHLAPHGRARSAMVDVHWRHANAHRHFGHVGLDMLAFKADSNQSGYLEGMDFGAMTLENMKRKLAEDFPRLIRDGHVDGITFANFVKSVSNSTMATRDMAGEIIQFLFDEGDLIVTGPKGKLKRSKTMGDNDIIRPVRQKQLILPGCGFPKNK